MRDRRLAAADRIIIEWPGWSRIGADPGVQRNRLAPSPA